MLNWRDSQHPDGGGSEVYAEQVADGLSGLGYDVTFFTAAYDGAAPAGTRSSGVRVVRRGGRRTVYLRAPIELLRGRLGRPGIVIEVQNGVPFLARLWSRTPVVVLVHHLHREQWPVIFGPVRARIGWWLESRLAPRVNARCAYVAVSHVTRAELVELGVPADHVEVIHNGTPRPLDIPIPRSSSPELLVLGRLVPHKRIELAIDAVAELAAEFPELTLTIAGRGWWAQRLRDHACERGVQDRVRFAGFVPTEERHRLYSSAWIHLMPSIKEGWGLVVVEAGAHGLPSIAFHGAGGVAESIVDGTTGLLATEGDPHDFTDKIRTLLRDPARREQLGRDATTYASRFSWDETVKNFERLISQETLR